MFLKTQKKKTPLFNGEGKVTLLLERGKKYYVGIKRKKKQSKKFWRYSERRLGSNFQNPPTVPIQLLGQWKLRRK